MTAASQSQECDGPMYLVPQGSLKRRLLRPAVGHRSGESTCHNRGGDGWRQARALLAPGPLSTSTAEPHSAWAWLIRPRWALWGPPSP